MINNETNPISDEDTDENDEETRELCEDYEELIAEGVKVCHLKTQLYNLS